MPRSRVVRFTITIDAIRFASGAYPTREADSEHLRGENQRRTPGWLLARPSNFRSLKDKAEIFYWDDYRHECDFIVKKGKTISEAIQVCYQLSGSTPCPECGAADGETLP